MLANLRGAVREALNFGERYQLLDNNIVQGLIQSKSDDPQVKEIIKAVPELGGFLTHNFMTSSLPGLDSQIIAILFNPIERAVVVIGDVNMMVLDTEGAVGRTHVSQVFLVNIVKVASAVGAGQAKVGKRGDKDGEVTLHISNHEQMELSIDGKSFPYITSLFLKITQFNQLTIGHSLVDRIILLKKYLNGETLFPES
jgi:hypothetical protein